ncbi:glycosyltransferase family 4 protein [Providencia rettgeri]
MNILLLNTSFLPQIGGVENSMRSLTECLSNSGHNITIIASDNGNLNLPRLEHLYGAEIIRYHHANFLSGIINLIKTLKLKKYHDYNIIISRNMITSLSLILLKFKNFNYIVAGVYKNQNKLPPKNSSITSKIKFLLNCQIDKYCFKKCDNIFVFSSTMQKQIINIFPRRDIKIIRPGVDANRFSIPNHSEKLALRKKYQIPLDKKIILGLGRFVHIKNYSTLISSMPNINDNYSLLLVGEGEELKKYNMLINKYNLHNRVFIFPKTEIPEEFYKLSDIFCLASTYEPFGQVLLEATSCGLHILALQSDNETIYTATHEIYKNYLDLVTFIPNNNTSSFSDTINSLPENINFHGRKDFLQRHSWISLIESLKVNR